MGLLDGSNCIIFLSGDLPFGSYPENSFLCDCILNNYTCKMDQGHPRVLTLNVCKPYEKQGWDDHRNTESWNNSGWKGPLKAI